MNTDLHNTGYRTVTLTVCDYNGRALRRETLTGLPKACEDFRNYYHDRLLNQYDRENVRLHVTTRDPKKAELAEGVDEFCPPEKRKRRSVGAAAPDDTAGFLFEMFRDGVAAPLYQAPPRPATACPYTAADCPRRAHACIRRRLACECGDAIKREETE